MYIGYNGSNIVMINLNYKLFILNVSYFRYHYIINSFFKLYISMEYPEKSCK